jgi:hypothetical protein
MFGTVAGFGGSVCSLFKDYRALRGVGASWLSCQGKCFQGIRGQAQVAPGHACLSIQRASHMQTVGRGRGCARLQIVQGCCESSSDCRVRIDAASMHCWCSVKVRKGLMKACKHVGDTHFGWCRLALRQAAIDGPNMRANTAFSSSLTTIASGARLRLVIPSSTACHTAVERCYSLTVYLQQCTMMCQQMVCCPNAHPRRLIPCSARSTAACSRSATCRLVARGQHTCYIAKRQCFSCVNGQPLPAAQQ